MTGTSRWNFDILKAIIGARFNTRLAIVTTMWNTIVGNQAEYTKRAFELQGSHMKVEGSRFFEFRFGGRRDFDDIFAYFLEGWDTRHKEQLQLVDEYEAQHADLKQTTAAKYILQGTEQQLSKFERKVEVPKERSCCVVL